LSIATARAARSTGSKLILKDYFISRDGQASPPLQMDKKRGLISEKKSFLNLKGHVKLPPLLIRA
jgi:hypothetical protein